MVIGQKVSDFAKFQEARYPEEARYPDVRKWH
jgi:hypothetical protein